MSTYFPKKEEVDRRWYVVDAEGKTLGRLSSALARMLTGKNKPTYTPYVDTGDFVVVVNAEKVALTGKKDRDKLFRHYTGFPGGLREQSAAERRRRHPERLIEEAVWGMLPKNRLGKRIIMKLKVYAGPDHPHAAQKPEKLELAV